MISGRLAEANHDTTNIQVIVTQGEEGEQLCLRDVEGIFLVTPPILPLPVSESSTPHEEESDIEGEIESFTTEMIQLRSVLQSFEEETVVLRTELQSTKKEVEQLRLVELWQENCKQLLDHDIVMAEKEKEVQLLREQLQVRELELARLKLTNLREVPIPRGTRETTIPAVSQQAAGIPVGDYVGELSFERMSRNAILTCLVQKGESGDHGKFVAPEISSHPSITKVTTLQVPFKQQGQAFTTTTTDLLTTKHVDVPTSNLLKSQVYDAISHPFQKVGNVTEPTHTTVTTLTQPTLTSKIPHVHGGQAQLNSPGGTQSLEQINKQSLTSRIQPDQQVTKLSASLSDILPTSRPISSIGIVNQGKLTAEGQTYTSRRGKAPPIDPYTAEDVRITFDDWLPILERAAVWNEWTPEESLMQLAGHLRGRALQEWKLLLPDDRKSYQAAVKALKERLDPGNQTLAALDFRHTSQKNGESVSDFIGRLENVFQTGFGREQLSNETREMLLYGQLQEGLLYSLMESPAVSGAQNYKELRLAAKREERRLAELKKKQQYLKGEGLPANSSPNKPPSTSHNWQRTFRGPGSRGATINKPEEKQGAQQQKKLRCYICDSPNHLARQCQQQRTESPGKKITQTKSSRTSDTRVIRTGLHMSVKKSGSCCVEVLIEGIPVTGLIDTGSDITIIRGDLFYQIVAEAHLKIQSLKTAEQKACTYDQKPITLDGQMDMKIGFGKKTIVTTVYVKLVAPDPLLLSENVCRLLGIVSYHPSVQSVGSSQLHLEETVSEASDLCTETIKTAENCDATKEVQSVISGNDRSKSIEKDVPSVEKDCAEAQQFKSMETDIPVVEKASKEVQQSSTLPAKDTKHAVSTARVRLVSAVRLPACHFAKVPVQIKELKGSVLIEPADLLDDSLQVDESLVEVDENGLTTLLITNNGKSPCHLKSGA